MPRPSSYVEPSVNGFSARDGRVRRHHVRVHHETARRDHDRTTRRRTRCRRTTSTPRRRPPRSVGRPDDQVGHAGLVADLDAGLLDPRAQQVHHHLGALGVAGDRDLVAARRRHRLLLERPDLLVAGEHQPLRPGLDDRLLGVVGPLELEAERLEPVEVLDRPLAVGADLVVLRLLGDRDEVLVHLLDGVVVAGRDLHRRAATEVEVPARHRRRTAVHGGLLQQQHARARPGRLQGGAAAGDAEADDHDVVRRCVGAQHCGREDVGDCGALAHGANLEQVPVSGDPGPRTGPVGPVRTAPARR